MSPNDCKAVFDQDERVGLWVCERLYARAPIDFGIYTTMGVEDAQGGLVAGAIFSNFALGNNIDMTLAGDSSAWSGEEILTSLFAYPLQRLGCVRITTTLAGSDESAIQLALRLGFQVEGKLRCAYDGKEDAVILGMLRRECSWLKPDQPDVGPVVH